MKSRRSKNRMLGAAGLFLLVICLLVFVETLIPETQEQDPTKHANVMEKDLYPEQGLPAGQRLSQEPLFVTDRVAVYKDRLFRLLQPDETSVQNTCGAMSMLRAKLPQTMPFYLAPVPTRGAISEQYGTEAQTYDALIDSLQTQLPSGVQMIDVAPALRAHRDEYLFFRTEDGWTARAAYYASAEIGSTLGITPFPLTGYNEFMYKSFKGALLLGEINLLPETDGLRAQLTTIPEDRIFYYLLPNSKNTCELWLEQDGIKSSEKKPTVTKSGTGLSSFLGGGYQFAVVEGDAKSKHKADSALLLLCDENGQLLAPYFANYYSKVYVVNVKKYHTFFEEMDAFLQRYPAEACVYAQTADEMGLSGKSRMLNALAKDYAQAQADASAGTEETNGTAGQ